jgi:phospholipase C
MPIVQPFFPSPTRTGNSTGTLGDPKNLRVNSLVFDHTSILTLIEWRWGLDPLTARDASEDINNLTLALDL